MSSSESLNRFLARQPILTVDKKSYAYEILSRYGPENYCRPSTEKTINVNAVDELFLRGITTMTEGLPAFINCTSNFLVNEYLTLLPREQVVAEILETVLPDPAVMAACRHLKSQGYVFALDDYCDSAETRPFLDFADFVKIDVLTTSFEEQKRIVAVCHQRGIPAIAEKVETDQQFQICKSLGYAFFQGYFFCRPQMVTRRSVAANKMVYLELLRAANEIEFNLLKIAGIFKRDVSLSYRLLRFLNSPLFGLHAEIRSIPHALSLMGERAMRKWISLVSIASLGDEAADGLLKLPLLRAMFCELLGKKIGMRREADELFLMGLLSVMDALLNMRMADVLAEIPVGEEIKEALLGFPSRYRPVFEVVLDYESGTWEQLANSSRAIGMDEDLLPDLYLRSVEWVTMVLTHEPVAHQPELLAES